MAELEEGDRWAPVEVRVADGMVTLKTLSPIRRFVGAEIEGVGVLREIDHPDGVLLGVVIPREQLDGDAS